MVVAEHFERKQQPRCRQILGVFAQIILIDLECRLAIQFEQNIALAAGNLACRPEWLPAAKTAVVQLQVRAIKANANHSLLTGAFW